MLGGWGGLEIFVVCPLFSDKAEDCGAVREAFILSLSHLGRGGGDGVFYLAVMWQNLKQAQVVVICIYVSLTTFMIVFMLFLFLLYQNPELAGQKKVCCGGMICFLNKHELQLTD